MTDVYVTGGIFRLLSGVLTSQNTPHLVWIGLVLLVLLSAVLLWPMSFAIRRIRGVTDDALRHQRMAHWLADSTDFLALVFSAGLAFVIMHTVSSNPMMLAFGAPGSAAPLFLIPQVLACLSLGLLLVGIWSWRKRCWQRAWRVYYSLVSLACIGFGAFLGYWDLF